MSDVVRERFGLTERYESERCDGRDVRQFAAGEVVVTTMSSTWLEVFAGQLLRLLARITFNTCQYGIIIIIIIIIVIIIIQHFTVC